jgi:hypothetical protein
MKIIEEGIPSSTSKPLVFLEGEKDHLLPVHDQTLRLTGAFKALGRIIGHSVLHGGPGLYGLSPAAKHYITSSKENIEDELHITLLDVPDVDLRTLITEVPYSRHKKKCASFPNLALLPTLPTPRRRAFVRNVNVLLVFFR